MKKLFVLLLMMNYHVFINNDVYAQSLTVSTSVTANISCHGGNNGSASSVPSGGTSPYTYNWIITTGGTNQTVSNLTAGTYTISVRDYSGATATAIATVTQPAALRDSIIFVTEPTCNGNTNGIISIGVKGGVTPYTYTWSPSIGTISAATGLTAGTYTISIEDNNGCSPASGSLTCTLTQPVALRDSIVSISIVNVSPCFGGNNGSATVGAKYGTLPYRYVWNPNVSITAHASGLTAGMYSVTVIDSNGCPSSPTGVTISQPSATFTATISSIINPSCSGGVGSATILVSGTTSPYTYLWTPGSQTTTAVTGLSAGNYTVTIACNTGCSRIIAVDITQPTALNVAATASNSSICSGSSDSIFAAVNGGTSPYTYSWSPGTGLSCTTCQKLNATSLTGLKTYSVTVTDHSGCSSTAFVNIDANISCSNTSCGSATSFTSSIIDSIPSDTVKWYTFADTQKVFSITVYELSGSVGQIHSLALYTSCGGHPLKQVYTYSGALDSIGFTHDTNTNASIIYYLRVSDATNVPGGCSGCPIGKVEFGIKRIGGEIYGNCITGCIDWTLVSLAQTDEVNDNTSSCNCNPPPQSDASCLSAEFTGCVGDVYDFSTCASNNPLYLTIYNAANVLVNTPSASNWSYQFNNSGDFTVQISAYSAPNYIPVTNPLLAIINPPPTPSFTMSPNPACIGEPVTIRKTDGLVTNGDNWGFSESYPTGPNVGFNWNPNIGTLENPYTTDPCSLYYNYMPGAVQVYLEETTGSLSTELINGAIVISGCAVAIPETFTVNDLAPTFTYTNTTSCGGGYITVFTNTSTCPSPSNPNYTWKWDFGDGNTSIGPEASHIYAPVPGTYYPSLTVTLNSGTCDGYSIASIASPTVTTTYTNQYIVLNGESSNANGKINTGVYTGSYYFTSSGVRYLENINTNNSVPTINIEGTFTVDDDECIFQDDDIYMGANSQIVIPPGKQLVINHCHLHACDNMWRGIQIRPGASLELTDGSSLIEDADTAIDCQDGGQYFVPGGTLNKNYVGIQVEPTTTSVGIIYNTQISCNNITSSPLPPYNSVSGIITLGATTTLNAPYSSQSSYKGIALDSVLTTQTTEIGSWGFGSTNTIENQYYGIYSWKSNFLADNNVFENIDDPGTHFHAAYGINGAGIYASGNGSGGGKYTANIGGPASLQNNAFQTCYNGIYLTNCVNANVGNNSFTYGMYGINIENNTSSTLNIGFNSNYNNTFTSLPYAIYTYNNPFSNMQINWNQIISGLTGVYVDEITPSPRNHAYVSGNTIGVADEGIWGQNFEGEVKSNNITVSNTCTFCVLPIIADGIYMESASNSIIYNNTITCMQTNRGDGIVMMAPSSSNNQITCNTINSGVNSTYFSGANPSTYFDYNQMNSYNSVGVYFNSTGDIGAQPYNGPAYGTSNYWNTCGAGSPWATYNGNPTSSTEFYVAPSLSGCNYLPTNNTYSVPATYPISFTSSTGVDCYVCSGTGPCANNRNISISLANSIASKSFSAAAGAYPTATLWDRKHDLFLGLKSYDSTYLDSSSTLRRFYDSVQTSNMGYLYNIATALSDSSGVSSTDIGTAEANYAAITSPDTAESTAQKVYNILISMTLGGTTYADSVQVVSLRSMAELCPLQYGYGVYIARALLSPVDTTVYRNTCEVDTNSSGERMDAPKPKPNLFANVYPNPANTMLNIQIKVVSLDSAQNNQSRIEFFYLYDNMGRLVQSTELKSNLSTIPLVQLPVGIYYYRVVDEEQNPIKTDKLLIIR